MADLVDRQEALRILDQIRASHASRTCSKSSIIQATAFEYAMEVIRKLPSCDAEKENQ